MSTTHFWRSFIFFTSFIYRDDKYDLKEEENCRVLKRAKKRKTTLGPNDWQLLRGEKDDEQSNRKVSKKEKEKRTTRVTRERVRERLGRIE